MSGAARRGRHSSVTVLVFLLAVTMGMFLVSYSAGLALLLGIGTAWSLRYVAGRILNQAWTGPPLGERLPSLGQRNMSSSLILTIFTLVLASFVVATLILLSHLLSSDASGPYVAPPASPLGEGGANMNSNSAPQGVSASPAASASASASASPPAAPSGEGETTVNQDGVQQDASARLMVVTQYSATIVPKSGEQLGVFTVTEKVNIELGHPATEEHLVSTHTLTPDDTRSGLLVREARLQPLESEDFTSLEMNSSRTIVISSVGEVTVSDPNRSGSMTKWEGILCNDRCPPSEIKLLDFPRGAFSEADNKNGLDIEPYQDTEEITWSVDDLSRDVAFSYIRSPLCCIPLIGTSLSTVLRPIEGVSSFGTFTIFVFGIVSTTLVGIIKLIASIVAEQTLIGWWDNRLKDRWNNRLKPRLLRTVRNIPGPWKAPGRQGSNEDKQVRPERPNTNTLTKKTPKDEERQEPKNDSSRNEDQRGK